MSGLGRFESVALFRNARCTLRLLPADGDEVSISGFVSSAELLGLHEFDDRIFQARVAVQVEEDSSVFDVNNF